MGKNIQVRIPENVDFHVLRLKVVDGELRYHENNMQVCLEYSQALGLCDTEELKMVILWNVYRNMLNAGDDPREDFENYMMKHHPEIATEESIRYIDNPGSSEVH